MREIKFRVFVKEGDSMLVSYDNNYLVSLDGVLNYDKGYEVNAIGQEENIISQYTGLKDSNGKLIYEGDILYSEFEEEYFEVYYEEEFGGYGIKGNRGFDKRGEYWDFTFLSIFLDQDDRSVTVEGNIYENPKLLSKLNEQK